MTTKEKAEELVDKYMNIKNVKLSDYSIIYLPTAKQCALIAVDEIINTNPKIIINWAFSGTQEFNNISYWQEVKQEIENL